MFFSHLLDVFFFFLGLSFEVEYFGWLFMYIFLDFFLCVLAGLLGFSLIIIMKLEFKEPTIKVQNAIQTVYLSNTKNLWYEFYHTKSESKAGNRVR